MERPSFTLGIEEEYLVVDLETRSLVSEPVAGFFNACNDRLGERVTNEFLQCQIEVGTKPHAKVSDAIGELREMRGAIAEVAGTYGYAPIAASTHPFARWRDQRHTPKSRYEVIEADIGHPARRMAICGMHIHVCIEDDDQRIDLMNQAAYFLPHLLALSCSSPFWEGEDTRLASYRLTVMDGLPRTGLPDPMASHSEYRRLVSHLVDAGCIEDATKIWWDIRPSAKFPTLEQRITDVCSRLEDTAAIAALYQSLLAFLHGLRTRNQRWRVYPPTMIHENRWRAQRYGVQGNLVDHGASRLTPFEDLIEELIDLVGPDADTLGCKRELLDLRRIAAEGTSATRQRRKLAEVQEAGGDVLAAQCAVVDALIAEYIE